MSNAGIVRMYRLFFALLAIAAMGYQLYHLYDVQEDVRVVNFFSFFTIESNIFASAIFLLAALTYLGRGPSRTFDMLRGAAVLYMTTTGVVYGLLLSGYRDELNTSVIWVDNVVHKIFPLVVFADWLIVPPGRRISFRQGLIWLAYPALYVTYTLIRGPRVDWYPYPFLDPRNDGGYWAIALYSVGIALGMLGFIWLVTWLTRVRVKDEVEPSFERRAMNGGHKTHARG